MAKPTHTTARRYCRGHEVGVCGRCARGRHDKCLDDGLEESTPCACSCFGVVVVYANKALPTLS